MAEIIKFETREMREFGKMWRRVWRKLSPPQQDAALRNMKKMLERMKRDDLGQSGDQK